LSDGGVIIHILRHHVDHFRKVNQRDKRRIESRGLRRIGECCARQVGIGLQPVIHIQNFLRIRRRGRNLR
jgi:hypothetical protein